MRLGDEAAFEQLYLAYHDRLWKRGSLSATTWLNENTLHYTPKIGGRNTLDLLGGLTLQRQTELNNNPNLKQNPGW